MKLVPKKYRKIEIVREKEPSLRKLLLQGSITEDQHRALCTGDGGEILLAFNAEIFGQNDEMVRRALIRKAERDGE